MVFGRGGRLPASPANRIRAGRERSLLWERFFNSPFSVAFDLRRLLRVRKEALAVCGGRRRGLFNGLYMAPIIEFRPTYKRFFNDLI